MGVLYLILAIVMFQLVKGFFTWLFSSSKPAPKPRPTTVYRPPAPTPPPPPRRLVTIPPPVPVRPATPPDPLAWLDRSVAFKRSGVKGDYPYFALLEYYPTNKYPDAPSEVQANRQLVWNFKEGYNSVIIAGRIASAIYNKLQPLDGWNERELILVTIPASTEHKNTQRFRGFCRSVAGQLKIQDGFHAISIVHDREHLRGTRGADKTENLHFNTAAIRGKQVLLFDDVKTTGASFRQVADRLMSCGASCVIGIFLAETYDSFHRGTPEWQRLSN